MRAEATALAAIELDLAGIVGSLELFGRLDTGLDLHGQVDLLGGGQQRDLADLLEVHAHRDRP